MKKIETLAEYQQLASRTLAHLPTKLDDLYHMNLGIVTEIGEFLDPYKKSLAYKKPLDLVNLGEELADICWYIANKSRIFFTLHTWEVAQDNFLQHEKEFKEIFLPGFAHLTQLQRFTILLTQVLYPDTEDYEVESAEKEFEGIKDMVILKCIAEELGLDFFQILTNNIAKLKVRYPEKFDIDLAQNRDLDAERVELEK